MKVEIWFMSGAGNKFTVIDNSANRFTKEKLSELATDLCTNTNIHRKPTEGLLVLNKSNKTDFDCWFFNPDGSSGMMCGNGARCIVAFAQKQGLLKANQHFVEFIMNDRLYTCSIEGESYEIGFEKPSTIKEISIDMIDSESKLDGIYVDNTSDHFCIDYSSLPTDLNFDAYPVETLSKLIQADNQFPNSVNVNFYKVNDNGEVSLRTFERGVNSETGACGTGALATGVAIDMNYNNERPYTIYPTSKIPLIVDKRNDKHYLKGPAEILGMLEVEL